MKIRKYKPKPQKRLARSSGRQSSLRDQQRWLRAVFEHSALGIARLDRHARIVDANTAFERFFGQSLADHSVQVHTIGVGVDGDEFVGIVERIADETEGLHHFTSAPDEELDIFYTNDLVNSLKTLTKEEFVKTVRDGRLEKGMQSFGNSPIVMDNIDNLYAYLKGRSDGAITRAKVEAMP